MPARSVLSLRFHKPLMYCNTSRKEKSWELSSLRLSSDSSRPVSYTHLDVYKRQASDSPTPVSELAAGEQLFEEMELGGIVNFIAFRQAVDGYNRIKEKSKPIMTLIDFSKPSTEKRFFVFDMEKKQLLFSSVVSHGRNSGGTVSYTHL